MSKQPSVYLAGPITGLNYGEATDWRESVAMTLAARGIAGFSPMRNKDYLLAENKIGDSYDKKILSTQAAITARDRFDVMNCDLVLFNFLGCTKASIGSCIEVGWADAFRKPAILVIEPEGAVHDHAMVRQICGWRADNLAAAIQVITSVLIP